MIKVKRLLCLKIQTFFAGNFVFRPTNDRLLLGSKTAKWGFLFCSFCLRAIVTPFQFSTLKTMVPRYNNLNFQKIRTKIVGMHGHDLVPTRSFRETEQLWIQMQFRVRSLLVLKLVAAKSFFQ